MRFGLVFDNVLWCKPLVSLWLPRQIPSSQQGTKPNFVQEKMIGDMGHICRVTLGLPILERLKQMIVHLTTVVRNWQIVFHPGSAGRGLHLPTWGYRPLQTSRHPWNQLATLSSIWHYSGLQLAQNWHQNVWDLRRNVTQYYNCMMHVLAKIKSHETRYVGLHFRVCLHKWRWIGRGPKGHQEPTALQWPNPKPTLSVRTGITYGYLFSYA